METLPAHKVYTFHPDTLTEVRKLVDLDKPGRMDEAIDILDNWVQQQNHFIVKRFNRDFLERTIINCKGSIERAKTRLDRQCTLKTLMPNFFTKINAKEDFQEFFEVQSLIPLPKLTSEHYRVVVVKMTGKLFKPNLFVDFARYSAIVCEHAVAHDYSNGHVLVLDYRLINNVTDLMANISLLEMRQAHTMSSEGYGMRTKGIHVISSSKMIDMFVKILKQVVSSKIGERIHVHKSIDALYEYVPKDILPVELGGEERSLEKLQSDWLEVYSSSKNIEDLKQSFAAKTNEDLRQKDKFNEEYVGIPGTFRTLSVD